MEKFDIDKLRSLPIENVATRLGFTINKHKALCPFHQDTRPSLTFNVRNNTYKCFVCDAHGGSIDLVMHHLNLNFAEACKWLANENNIILTEYKPITKPYTLSPKPSVDIRHLAMLIAQPYLCSEAKKFLFDERKIKPEVVKQLGLSSISSPVPMSGDLNGSWFNAPSLLIPYKDIDGNLVSVQARYLGESVSDSHCNHPDGKPSPSQNKPRFQFPKGSKCSIFNIQVLKEVHEGEHIFITEGVTDCLSMLSAGYPAIAIPSATLLTERDKKFLLSLTSSLSLKWHMYPDRDSPGERLYLDLKILIPDLIRHQLPEGFKDVGQYWAHIHREDY